MVDIFSNIADEIVESVYASDNSDTINDLIYRLYASQGSRGMISVINACLPTSNVFPYLALLISFGGKNTYWTVDTLTVDGSHLETLRYHGIQI